jgi:hypothetical protein
MLCHITPCCAMPYYAVPPKREEKKKGKKIGRNEFSDLGTYTYLPLSFSPSTRLHSERDGKGRKRQNKSNRIIQPYISFPFLSSNYPCMLALTYTKVGKCLVEKKPQSHHDISKNTSCEIVPKKLRGNVKVHGVLNMYMTGFC